MESTVPLSTEEFLDSQQSLDLLRFITCGSVDDGKSTLIGRLLWDSKQLFDDQLASLSADSKKHGTQGEDIDFALLVDGLAAEREQGITIDVAYRFFSTRRRKFIVADTPGHEQYTRNMVTGASTAQVAILLVDSCQGLLTQTRRHAYLASLMGIRHVVLAVNKMDRMHFQSAVFHSIRDAFETFAHDLHFTDICAIPLSALKGDNVTHPSDATPWYQGPTLIEYLETVAVPPEREGGLIFPVQWVNRPHSDFRGFCGTVERGRVRVGDTLRVTSSGQTAQVSALISPSGPVTEAVCGDALTLTLAKEIDISRGDVLSPQNQPLETTDHFEATLVWMGEEPGHAGRTYALKLATQWTTVTLTGIKYRVDINTLSHEATRNLALNDICVCTLACSKPLAFDHYENSKALGGFILVDRFTHATVAAGMIRHTLRRAQNVHRQSLTLRQADRERMNGHKGCVIWFTGLSGSGKSTLANTLEMELHAQGKRTYILDGDNIRQGLNKDLGFTEADRVENIRRVAEVAKLMCDAGLIVMTAFISPFRNEREMARDLIGAEQFIEVYVSTPLEVCEQRDPKGLYQKARNGQLPNMTGINSPYEAPEHPQIVIDGSQPSSITVLQKILALLEHPSKSDDHP